MRQEIRFAGFGGQGIALAGYVLGKALALYDDLEAVMTQAYGPEARGGASSASVVVSDSEIAYPFVQQPDVLVAFSQEAYARFQPGAKAQAKILVDEDLVDYRLDEWHYAIPATRLAEGMGRRIVANMVMLGFFTAVTEVVSPAAMQRSIESAVKPATLELNLRAFISGYNYAGLKEMAR